MVLSDALEIAAAIKGCGSDYSCGKDDNIQMRTKCLLSLDEWKLIIGSYEPSWLMVGWGVSVGVCKHRMLPKCTCFNCLYMWVKSRMSVCEEESNYN